MAAGANPMDVKRGMQKAVKAAVGAFTANSKKVSGSADIARVATVSAGDETVGTLIAEAMEKVGADGVITIEESKTAETYSEVVEGMQFDRGYITPYMAVSYTHLDVYKRQVLAVSGLAMGALTALLLRALVPALKKAGFSNIIDSFYQ